MATIDFKPGGTGPIVMRFEDEAGEVIPYQRTQLRIAVGAACLIVEGTLAGDEWEYDLDALPLTPRLHSMGVWWDAGAGYRFARNVNLHVLGGC